MIAPDRLLANIALLCKEAELHDELDVLVNGQAELSQYFIDDRYGGHTLTVRVDAVTLARIDRVREELGNSILAAAESVSELGDGHVLKQVRVVGELCDIGDEDWRLAGRAYLAGLGEDRRRSDS